MINNLIYLDNNATTKLDPQALEAMLPFLTNQYANASSTHRFGLNAEEAVKNARNQVAELIGADPNELTFTSGATEAINLALKGGQGKHIVTCTTEHSAVLDTCMHLETLGYEITYLKVDKDGLIDLNQVKQALRKDTALLCIMAINNETGVIQPISELAEIAKASSALFMTDATQAVGKFPINVKQLGIDIMSFSAHKFYGPKGVGALYTRKGVKLNPLMHGGGHEKGLRSGTLNVPGIIGLGKAAEICIEEMEGNARKIEALRAQLETTLLGIEGTFLNGSKQKRIFNVSNICFEGIDADMIISGLPNIAVSNGSACTSTVIEPSHVLKAMGLSDAQAFSSIRFSIGKFNTAEEISVATEKIKALITGFRLMANQ